MTSRFW